MKSENCQRFAEKFLTSFGAVAFHIMILFSKRRNNDNYNRNAVYTENLRTNWSLKRTGINELYYYYTFEYERAASILFRHFSLLLIPE